MLGILISSHLYIIIVNIFYDFLKTEDYSTYVLCIFTFKIVKFTFRSLRFTYVLCLSKSEIEYRSSSDMATGNSGNRSIHCTAQLEDASNFVLWITDHWVGASVQVSPGLSYQINIKDSHWVVNTFLLTHTALQYFQLVVNYKYKKNSHWVVNSFLLTQVNYKYNKIPIRLLTHFC